MIQVTSRQFRDNQANVFGLIDKGEEVVIRRKGRSYMITLVDDSDFVVSPELERKLEIGRQEYREGKATVCNNIEELRQFLESL